MSNLDTAGDIPEPIRVFFDAVNSHNAEQLRSTLGREALLDDGQERIRGLDPIVNWVNDHLIETNMTLEMVGSAALDDGLCVVNVRRRGGFDDAGQLQTVEETYFFLISETRIAALTIRFVGGSDSIKGMMRDITIGELQRTEVEIDNIYKNEHEKLTTWKAEMAGLALENEITSCIERLQSAHSAANEFKSVAAGFNSYLSNGLSSCLRIYWKKVSAQPEQLIPGGDRLLPAGQEFMRQDREVEGKLTALLDELEHTDFRDVPAAVEKIKLSLPEKDHFSFEMSAGTLVMALTSMGPSIKIARSVIGLGEIWRLFLYAYAIELYGDKLRQGEQVDALSELGIRGLIEILPAGEFGLKAFDAFKRLTLLRGRAQQLPSIISQTREMQQYLLAYSGLLAAVELLLSSSAKSINDISSTLR